MDTKDYILKKFKIDLGENTKMPVEIPNFGREALAKLFYELKMKTGAEIGVFKGRYSKVLCEANPDLKLYCVDPWLIYDDYKEIKSKRLMASYYKKAMELLSPYNVSVIKKSSMDAIKDFKDGSLDFVYIDGNHAFRSVIDDIDEWSKKVRVGGIISGHDYKDFGTNTTIQVMQAVDAYTDAYKIRPWFVLGRYRKQPGETRDRVRSWMWVKV